MLTRRSILVATVAAMIAPLSAGAADSTVPPVVMHIKAIHCAKCAKKIAAKLKGVDGVSDVQADVKKDLAFVTTAKGKSPSARAMWEAVEAAGFKPVKLVTPAGTFTDKPEQP